MNDLRRLVRVPGSDRELVYEREEDGRLRRLTGNGRVYYDSPEPGRMVFDQGLARVESTELPGGLLRSVRCPGSRWVESYGWDGQGLLTEIDGVALRYDEQSRIVACHDGTTRWTYAYSGAHLTVIDTPSGLRQIVRGEDGRPVAMRDPARQVAIAYDASGRRQPTPHRPDRWGCDPGGRLWTVRGPEGRVERTYLWDDYRCLGRIDGEVGEPLSAVFSLDPTGTPVRVITRDGARRIPRDAFGEALLGERFVPGLFGGAVAGGFVHLPCRRLDPRTGSFDVPDPWHGEADDPRRAAGFGGPLPVDRPLSGPYTVCRNNPLSLADPTGAISDYWWLLPSALTWSLQNTIASLMGMWLNLEFSPLGMIISACTGASPFDIEWIGANNYDTFAMRSDGWLARLNPQGGGTFRTWTMQFLVNAPENNFTTLEDARLFAPSAAFRPRLYGNILRCSPQSAAAFLMGGQRIPPNGATLLTWSRNGGTAEPVMPGSLIPVFPSGGLHFGNVQRDVRKQTGEVVELEPSGGLLSGTISVRALIDVPGTGLGLAPNALVVLSGASAVEVARVVAADEVNGRTQIRVDTTGAGVGTTGIRVEGLSALVGTENLTPIAGQNQRLSVAGSSNDYRPGASVLRLNRAGAAVGYAKVTGFEAQVGLDEALPATLGASLRVRPAAATGGFNATLTDNASILRIDTGAVPGPGSGLVVGAGANAIPAIVQTVNGQRVTVDRPLSPLGGDGTAVGWQNLAPLPAIGRSGPPDAAAQLTYIPDRPSTAPTTGFLWVEGSTIATRRITALNYDALVLGQVLPDALAAAFSVDRFLVQPPDVSGGTASSAQVLALNAPPSANARAFHVLEANAATLSAGTVLLTGAALAGNTVTLPINPATPPAGLAPGQVVALQAGAGPIEAAAVRRMRLTATLTRNLPLNPNGLEAVLLAPGTPAYPGLRRGDRTFRVQPTVAGNTTDMPRFTIGELVQVTWTLPTPGELLYRVQFVNGTTVTGSDDEAIIPATVTNLTVNRLVVQDPGSGSSRLGIEGEALAPNQVRFSVWTPGAFNLNTNRLGIIDGQNVFAANLAAGNQPLDLVLLQNPGIAGPLNVAALPTAGAISSGFSGRFAIDGAALTFLDTPLTSPLTGLVLAVPYIETTQRVTGSLESGSVRIPDDHENAAIELDRRQALEDHELVHTQQAARYGPWLLSYIPLWLFELGSELPLQAGLPEFSRYVPATVGSGSLTIPGGSGVAFATEDHVQVAQGGRAAMVRLGAREGETFRLTAQHAQALAQVGIVAGAAQVRREESGRVEIAEGFINVLQFLTVGGLMNHIAIAGWGGVAFGITQLVQWIRGLARNKVTAQLATDNVTLTLPVGKRVEGLATNSLLAIQAEGKTYVRPVERIDGQTVVLAIAAPLKGAVTVSNYTPSTALFPHWHDYYPAAVPDPNRPAALQVQPVGGKTLTLAVNDRVHIRSTRGGTKNTVVTAVGAGGLVEVEEATLISPDSPDEFFIAKIGEDDPMGFADQWALNQLHLGWMQYLHDPWGQIVYRSRPTSTVGQILARSARYVFGTQAWGAVPLGYWLFDNALQQSNAQRSEMEQEASRRSGDTYCPIGTLNGDMSVVGDVVRYWLTETGGQRNNDPPAHEIILGRQDAPGANAQQYVTVNLTTGGLPTGLFQPDAFTLVNGALNVTGVSSRGWIPVNPVLERTTGAYIAFTRPGSHTVTAQAIPSLANSLDAQNNGFPNLISHQRNVADVVVTLATLAVAENAVIDLIPFQRALFSVTPDGSRVYRATLSEPGVLATIENGLDVVMNGIAPAAVPAGLGTENVEVSRFHRFNAATGSFDSGLGPVHLPADLDIAVRRLQIRLVNTLPMRADADVTAAVLTNILPGNTGVILAPAPIVVASITTAVTGTPALVPTITPLAPVPAAAQGFVRDGGALQVLFPADQPPEAQAVVTITIPVGPPGATAVPVTCQVTVDPHFTLDSATGFSIARGATLTLRSSDATNITMVNVIPGVTVTPNNAEIALAVTPAAPLGAQVVLAQDIANPQRMARRTITITA